MQALKQNRRADYQDVLNAPAHMVAEVIDGALHTQPRPAMPHAWASSGLGARINPPFNYGDGGPGGWWIVDEPELHLGEDILVPDLAGWRRERMPDYPDTAYVTLAPDWACEVLSPGTRKLDLYEKRPDLRPGRRAPSVVRRSARPRAGSVRAPGRPVGADRIAQGR